MFVVECKRLPVEDSYLEYVLRDSLTPLTANVRLLRASCANTQLDGRTDGRLDVTASHAHTSRRIDRDEASERTNERSIID